MNNRTLKLLGAIVTIGVISYGVWLFFDLSNNQKKPSPLPPSQEYTAADIAAYTQQCKQSLSISTRYPEITQSYCDCYVAKVTAKYTKQELEGMGTKTRRERDSLLNDIINSCAKATGRDTVR